MLTLHQGDALMMQKSFMKALTIRKLPQEVADAVHRRAEEAHMSLSKALITLLEEKIVGRAAKKKKKRDLNYIAGSWSDQAFREFDESLAEQRKIDPGMWK